MHCEKGTLISDDMRNSGKKTAFSGTSVPGKAFYIDRKREIGYNNDVIDNSVIRAERNDGKSG